MKNRTTACKCLIALIMVLITLSSPTSAVTLDLNEIPLGIADFDGKWIVKPQFKRVVHIVEPDLYWCKKWQPKIVEAKSQLQLMLSNWTNKNNDWICLDRMGQQQNFSMPCGLEPLSGHPELLGSGIGEFSNQIIVQNEDGNLHGLCDFKGKTLLNCEYSEITEVGERKIVTRKPYSKPLELCIFEFFFPPGLGGDAPPAPPYELADENGKFIATLQPNARNFFYKFHRGILLCDFTGPGAIDSRGNRVNLKTSEIQEFHLLEAEAKRNKNFEHVYSTHISPNSAIKFLPFDYPSLDSKFCAIVPMNKTLGLVQVWLNKTQLGRGLIDPSGNWVIKPEYLILAYSGENRIIASKRFSD